MIHSASKIQKMSCSQLNYLYRHQPTVNKTRSENFFAKPEPTDAQLEGNKQALLNSYSPYIEMSSSVVLSGDTVYYSFDEIRHMHGKTKWLDKYYLFEHKLFGLEDWYLEFSLIQVAFYRALHSVSDKQYVTASFFVDEGNSRHTLDLTRKECVSILQYGDLFYSVTVNDPEKILRFFAKKLEYSRGYDSSRAFDKYWRRREWDYFKNCMSSKRWKPSSHFLANNERLIEERKQMEDSKQSEERKQSEASKQSEILLKEI